MPTDNSIDILKDVNQARGELYAFLCRSFGNVPNNEFYTMLAEISPKLVTLSENTDNDGIKSGVNGINEFLRRRDACTDGELAELDLDTLRHYTTLFCLTNSIPTDESYYTSDIHQSRQDAYDDMVYLFKKYSLIKSPEMQENDDFISYELAFMARMAHDSVKLLNAGEYDGYNSFIKEQHAFHENHFDKWVYTFFNTVSNYDMAGERLYKHLAGLAHGFVSEDKLMLKELPLS